MTDKPKDYAQQMTDMAGNFTRMMEQSTSMMTQLFTESHKLATQQFDPLNISPAFTNAANMMLRDPQALMQANYDPVAGTHGPVAGNGRPCTQGKRGQPGKGEGPPLPPRRLGR